MAVETQTRSRVELGQEVRPAQPNSLIKFIKRVRTFCLGGEYDFLLTDNQYYAGITKTGLETWRFLWRRRLQGLPTSGFEIRHHVATKKEQN